MWIRVLFLLTVLSVSAWAVEIDPKVDPKTAAGIPGPAELKGTTASYSGTIALINGFYTLTVFNANNVRTAQKIALTTTDKEVGIKMKELILRGAFVNASGYISDDRSSMVVTSMSEGAMPKRIKF